MSLNDYLRTIMFVDIMCIQETKGSKKTLEQYTNLKDYKSFFSYNKIRNGHSGVCIIVSKMLYVKRKTCKFNSIKDGSEEGRLIMLDCGSFRILNVYFPFFDSDNEDDIKYEKMKAFYNQFFDLVRENKNNLVICGDFNATYKLKDHYQYHQELVRIISNRNELDFGIDGKIQKSHKSATSLPWYYKDAYYLENDFFEKFQRKWMHKFVESLGLIDLFDYFHPDTVKYTCWNTILNLRQSNLGTRIDYIFVSSDMLKDVKSCEINNNIYGSDHCPVIADIDLKVLDDSDNLMLKKEGLHAFFQQR